MNKESQAYLEAEEVVVLMYKAAGKRPLISFWKDTRAAKRQAEICVRLMISALRNDGIVGGVYTDHLWEVIEEIPNVGI